MFANGTLPFVSEFAKIMSDEEFILSLLEHIRVFHIAKSLMIH